MLEALLSTQSSGGAKSAGKKSTDEVAMDLAKDMESRMPDTFDIRYAEKKFPFSKFESLNTYLLQEMGRFNKLLKGISSSLKDLQKAIVGEVVMNEALEGLMVQMINSQIPVMWLKNS